MTWTCCKCHEPHADEFDQCWNCGTDYNGFTSPDFEQYFAKLTDSERDDLLLGRMPVPLPIPAPDSLQAPVTHVAQQQPLKNLAPERPPPNPFQHRLNAYLHRDVNEPIPTDAYRSRMPFWVAQIQLAFTPTKTLEQIRRLLIRIRENINQSRMRK